MLWKEVNEDPIPTFLKAYDHGNVPFLESMSLFVKHEWKERSTIICNCGFPIAVAGLIAGNLHVFQLEHDLSYGRRTKIRNSR